MLLPSRSPFVLALAALALAPAAEAAPKKLQPKALAKLDLRPMLEKLGSGDPARVGAALAEARAAGARAADAAPAVEALLARGLSRALIEPALEALGAVGQPSSSAVVRVYLSHRVPEVRRVAAKALASTKGPDATAALREALRGSDAEVRSLAAAGLAQLGATEALPELLLALDRGVALAAPAVGGLCKQAECDKLLERLGKLAFDVVIPGVEAVVKRTPAFPDEYVVAVLGRIRDLGTPEAKRWLQKLDAEWPSTGSKRVKKELEALIPTIVAPS